MTQVKEVVQILIWMWLGNNLGDDVLERLPWLHGTDRLKLQPYNQEANTITEGRPPFRTQTTWCQSQVRKLKACHLAQKCASVPLCSSKKPVPTEMHLAPEDYQASLLWSTRELGVGEENDLVGWRNHQQKWLGIIWYVLLCSNVRTWV